MGLTIAGVVGPSLVVIGFPVVGALSVVVLSVVVLSVVVLSVVTLSAVVLIAAVVVSTVAVVLSVVMIGFVVVVRSMVAFLTLERESSSMGIGSSTVEKLEERRDRKKTDKLVTTRALRANIVRFACSKSSRTRKGKA